MSAIRGDTGAGTRMGRGTGQTDASVSHRLAARRQEAPTRAELQQEARENKVPYYYRMKVDKLEDLKSRNWQFTDEDLADFIVS